MSWIERVDECLLEVSLSCLHIFRIRKGGICEVVVTPSEIIDDMHFSLLFHPERIDYFSSLSIYFLSD